LKLGLKPEELLEELKPILAKDSIVWLSVEEARVWGFNCIYYTIRVEPHLPGAIAAFEYVTSTEDLIPIAIVVLLPSDLDLNKLSAMSKEFNIYLFGGGDVQGAIIPLDEYGLRDRIVKSVKRVLEVVKGIKDFEPIIDGYYLDLLTI